MADKKKDGFSSTVVKLVLLATNFFSFMDNLTALIKLEARLAGKSLVAIVILSFLIVTLITSSWLLILTMLYFYFISLQWTATFSIFILLLFNIFFLVIVGIILSKVKNDLLFPLSREKCRGLRR